MEDKDRVADIRRSLTPKWTYTIYVTAPKGKHGFWGWRVQWPGGADHGKSWSEKGAHSSAKWVAEAAKRRQDKLRDRMKRTSMTRGTLG